MNKKISLGVAISLIAIAAALTFILTSAFSLHTFNGKIAEVADMAEKYERLDDIDAYVRENFYTEINENDLMNGILKGYVSGLNDRYARYMTPSEYREAQANDKGILTGIGISVNKEESGYMQIAEITANTPAAKSSLQVGDVVVAVDGEDVLTIGYDEAVNRVRGTAGTEVKLTIRRDGRDQDMTFVRQEIEIISATGEMLNGGIGYLRVDAFHEATVEQYKAALSSLQEQGATALIFDLRNNGGGLLNSVEACLDPLLPEGDVAYAVYHDGKTETIVSSDAAELTLPMAVLVNEHTASAAELFASALRDFDKAKLYGTNTFGKGIMQNTVSLKDGGGLTLTVATYRTVNSECYHGVGLVPDETIALPEDSMPLNELSHADDPQLQGAINALLFPEN